MSRFIRLLPDSIQPQGQSKVIKADAYQAYLDANDIIDQAKQLADEIIAKAQQERQQEQQLGYQRGLQQAQQEQAERMLDTLSTSVDYLSQIEQQLTQLVHQAVSKILADFDDHELLQRVVSQALATVRSQHTVTLRVEPNQVEAMKQSIHTLLANYPAINYVDVIADRRLTRGGCILETAMGTVDASIDTQLKALENSLCKRVASQHTD